MAVKRIERIDIDHSPMFVGIYGSSGTSEYFIEQDLRKYSLWQELYLYLRSQGYLTLFYNNNDNFFSYEESQLVEFLNLPPVPADDQQPSSTRRAFDRVRSPFASARRNGARIGDKGGSLGASLPSGNQAGAGAQRRTESASAATARVVSHHEQILVRTIAEEGTFFRNGSDENVFERIFSYVDRYSDPPRKLAVIFTNPNTLVFSPEQTRRYEDRLRSIMNGYEARQLRLKIIALYSAQTIDSFISNFEAGHTEFFYQGLFRDLLFPNPNSDGATSESPSMVFLPYPEEDEVGNWLNRCRLLQGLKVLFDKMPFGRLCFRLWQDMSIKGEDGKPKRYDYICQRNSLSTQALSDYIEGLSTETSWERLNRMKGIDNVRLQFDEYLKALRIARDAGTKFMPHMVFLGNPGTGKTTLAKLFAEILHDEGLLPKGQVIEATVGDLEGQYVGETRVKTRALCDRAKGGVLFIDEAYGLNGGGGGQGHADYGKEAVEVLIQFMTNNCNDSIVILAGYEKETLEMIKTTNPGFDRRISSQGRFYLNDYSPDILLEIMLHSLAPYAVTPEFRSLMLRIATRKYQMRDKNWGNAGTAEEWAGLVRSNHIRLFETQAKKQPIGVEAVPEDWKRLVSNEGIDDEAILSELNAMRGMETAKQRIMDILYDVKFQREEMELEGGESVATEWKPYYVLTGNPGTGKTSIARIMAKIFCDYGLLAHADVTPVTKEQLVSNQVGQTPALVRKVMEDHINGVLFVDEAYQLNTPDGKEAIDAMTTLMLDPMFYGKLAIIMAGYTDPMDRLLRSNPGLLSRFQEPIHIDNYTTEELWEILQDLSRTKRVEIDSLCKDYAMAWFLSRSKDSAFANARECGNLFEKMRQRHVRRLSSMPASVRVDPNVRYRYTPDDCPNYEELNSLRRRSQNLDLPGAGNISDRRDGLNGYSRYRVDLTREETGKLVTQDADYDWATGLIEVADGTGTGFIVSIPNRLMLTCCHVITDTETKSVFTDISVSFKAKAFCTKAQVVWADYGSDTALLQLDALSPNTKYFDLDSRLDTSIARGERIIHSGYPHGTMMTSNLSVMGGEITTSERGKQLNDHRFDVLFSNVNAIDGCSGGPVFRASDHVVVGILQGGFASDTRIIIDIHQLFGLLTITKRPNQH